MLVSSGLNTDGWRGGCGFVRKSVAGTRYVRIRGCGNAKSEVLLVTFLPQNRQISNVYNPSVSFADSSPYTGEPLGGKSVTGPGCNNYNPDPVRNKSSFGYFSFRVSRGGATLRFCAQKRCRARCVRVRGCGNAKLKAVFI